MMEQILGYGVGNGDVLQLRIRLQNERLYQASSFAHHVTVHTPVQ